MSKKTIECICGGTAKLVKHRFELFDGRIVIDDDEMYKCQKCGDLFATSEQMSALEKKIRERYNIQRQVISTGRSLAITFTKDLQEFYNIKKGNNILIFPNGPKEAILRFK